MQYKKTNHNTGNLLGHDFLQEAGTSVWSSSAKSTTQNCQLLCE